MNLLNLRVQPIFQGWKLIAPLSKLCPQITQLQLLRIHFLCQKVNLHLKFLLFRPPISNLQLILLPQPLYYLLQVSHLLIQPCNFLFLLVNRLGLFLLLAFKFGNMLQLWLVFCFEESSKLLWSFVLQQNLVADTQRPIRNLRRGWDRVASILFFNALEIFGIQKSFAFLDTF